jgi:hypothetical protein
LKIKGIFWGFFCLCCRIVIKKLNKKSILPAEYSARRIEKRVAYNLAGQFYPWQVPTKRRFERAVLLFKLDEICAKIKGILDVL